MVVDKGVDGACIPQAVHMPGEDGGNLLLLQVGNRLVQDGKEPGVGIAADTYGDVMGKDYGAGGVEVQVAAVMDVVVDREAFQVDKVCLAVTDCLEGVFEGGVVAYLGAGVILLDIGTVVEMAPGAGNNRFLRQGHVPAHDGHIVQPDIGLGKPDLVFLGPVVVGVDVGNEVNLSRGHGLQPGGNILHGG